VGADQVGADVRAGGVARLLGLHEADARAHEQRLDRGHRGVQGVGQLGVGEPVELAHEQGRALLLGQPLDVLHQLAQVLAADRLGLGVVRRRARQLVYLGRRRQRAAQVVDAAVVGDAVQPGAQRHRPIVVAQRAVGAQEDVLQDVLGVRARRSQHLARVGEQALAIAVVDGPERIVVSHPEEGYELIVGPQPQQPTVGRDATEARRRVEC
jgi:hypothetical protein